ncbi:hypothetical protein ACRRTK_019298 [Alexandromys fortis]
MAHMNQHQDPNFYNTGKEEIKVEIEDEQETAPAEERRSFGESALGFFVEEPRYQVFTSPTRAKGATKVQDSYSWRRRRPQLPVSHNPLKSQSGLKSQNGLKSQSGLKSHYLPESHIPRRNTRPRIRRGVTPWQLSELEGVFEENQYPGEITKKDLARRLYMKVSEVHCWLKKRRAKYRKNQRLQMVKGAPDGTQKISH